MPNNTDTDTITTLNLPTHTSTANNTQGADSKYREQHSLGLIRLQNLPILFDELQLSQAPLDKQQLIAQIDACLPQTQCGLCDHPDGCLPYATAIVMQNEAHNKCVPGGQPVSDHIADILGRSYLEAVASKWQTNPDTQRPTEVRAIIREDDCIGCTKCIPACPVDAIVGTGKHMHTIFTDLCTGCELCLPPCPVDCIDLVEIERVPSEAQRQAEQSHLRGRYHTHLNRVAKQMQDKANTKPVVSMVQAKLNNATNQSIDIDEAQAKNTIEQAKLRTKIKKLQKQLSVRANPKKQAELEQLQAQLAQVEKSSIPMWEMG
ncbi:RnfABCDGE type electron transport complex subunit B [Psychrobacter sp. I-STPA10]|uniref:RnfABCDGE type electron transport complex subunit B n=1 Tax=Psychrobacter sp. I-STPA10 TaxID=2585769 RepID=UPI001E4097E6|nr:RnfABCDGE type electron transport complex subunit B [Psychrobacter sp. I-STPA10]